MESCKFWFVWGSQVSPWSYLKWDIFALVTSVFNILAEWRISLIFSGVCCFNIVSPFKTDCQFKQINSWWLGWVVNDNQVRSWVGCDNILWNCGTIYIVVFKVKVNIWVFRRNTNCSVLLKGLLARYYKLMEDNNLKASFYDSSWTLSDFLSPIASITYYLRMISFFSLRVRSKLAKPNREKRV